MKLRRVKFIWGTSRVLGGRWHLGLFERFGRAAGGRADGLAISIRGVLLWALALGAIAYGIGATALFWIWQRNPYSLLTLSDALCFPLRRAEVSEKKGRAFIAEGTDLFRARKYYDSATLLRLGLARCPRDLPARLLLARYYFLANQRATSQRILEEGLTDAYPGRPYLEALFNAAELGEDFSRIVELAGRYAPRLRTEALMRDYRWVIGRQFTALLAAGRPTEGLALAMNEAPGESARERRVLALLALGRAEEAVTFLEEWQRTPGADSRAVARLRVRALREAQRFEEMQSTLVELRALNPAEPAPAVYGVIQRALGHREAEADAAMRDYLFRFSGTIQNLVLLAEPLAEIGDLPRLERCVAAAAEQGYPMAQFHVLLLQQLVNAGRFAEASRLLAAVPAEPARAAWRMWMQRVIDAGLTPNESTQLALLEFLRDRPWPIQVFRRTTDALVARGLLETARDVLAIAARGFPNSAWVRTQGTKVAAELTARAPVATTAVAATARLPGEKVFFEQLDGAIGARQWEEAARLVHEARAAKPPPMWVENRESSLLLAQMRISQGGLDRAGMMTAVRLFLNGDNERSRQVLEVAQDFHRAGDTGSAQSVVREVLSRSPDYAPARRLLAEWEPKPEAEKK